MGISRRSVLIGAVAGTGLGATAIATALPSQAASAAGDVVGKITVGYQGWFACIGDGAPINGWWHWAQNWGQPPSPSNNGTLRAWPDMREYPRGYQTAYANLGNGQPATLFSHWDQTTVNLHFLWMQQNGIDTAALQRFNPNGSEGPTRDGVTTRVRSAAEAYGRKFYVMYDVSGWTNMQAEIKTDWTSKMSAHTASAAYARQNGKPVVCVWGFGFSDANHPFTAAACLDVINWFKGQGCYVIGGVPTHWRDGTSDSRAGFLDVYHAFNMLSPWMVGRIGTAADSDNFYTNVNVPDQTDCNAHGIDYQPCVLPGDVSARQRAHGDFMWRQFYNMVRAGCQGIYISMFDEFNEGNQIVKTAESQAFIPTNAGLLGLDEDGTACSSDYYLRLTGDGGRMLKGQLALTATRPTVPVPNSGGGGSPSGPTFYSDINYGGAAVTLGTGNYDLAQLQSAGIANDSISSIRVPAGYTVTAYADSGFSGTSWTFTTDNPNLINTGNNDAITSLRVTTGGGGGGTQVISLRAHANNLYVCADNAGANPLIANRTAAGSWETFDVLDAGNGNIALRSHANNLIVTAENAGANPLIANRTTVGGWETFQLIHNPDGSVSLRALANNLYVTAENAGASALIANRTAIGGWEEFDLITH